MNEFMKQIEVLRGRLRCPVVFFDIEATGLDPAQDRIVSLAMLKVYPLGNDGTESPAWRREYIQESPGMKFYQHLFNPGRDIAEEATAVHGITHERVKGEPLFVQHAFEVMRFLRTPVRCNLSGYNLLNFDVPLLYEEFARAGMDWDWVMGVEILDVSNVFRKKEERTLSAAMKFFCGQELQGAHNASADVMATALVLLGQLRRYPDLEKMTMPELANWSRDVERLDLCGTIVRNAKGLPAFNTKRNRGVPVMNDPGYAKWMLGADFHSHTKQVLRKILEGKLT